MSYIQTARNRVYVGKPLPTDTVVVIYLNRDGERPHLFCVQPVSEHRAAVEWALSMADFMQGPITVTTCESEEWLHHSRLRCDMHEIAFAGADPEVRQDAFEVLTSLADWNTIRERRLQ